MFIPPLDEPELADALAEVEHGLRTPMDRLLRWIEREGISTTDNQGVGKTRGDRVTVRAVEHGVGRNVVQRARTAVNAKT